VTSSDRYSSERVLVAGVGNIFLGDDGFGPEVARRMLAGEPNATAADPDRADAGILPDGVRVVDYGIRGMHLAYDLLDGVDVLVLIDALPGHEPPGTIRVLRIGPEDLGEGQFDAHGMDPVAVLASLRSLGGQLPTTYVVGCQPADVTDGIGLSPPVAAAVDEAVATVRALIKQGVTAGVPIGREG
jgi:hydrogenase maturation protease